MVAGPVRSTYWEAGRAAGRWKSPSSPGRLVIVFDRRTQWFGQHGWSLVDANGAMLIARPVTRIPNRRRNRLSSLAGPEHQLRK